MTKKITKTFLRSEETMRKYFEFSQKVKEGKEKSDFDTDLEKIAIKKFKYWMIIENKFPYDVIADISHMLLPIRKVAFNWDLLSREERDELEELKKTYIQENYDVIYENTVRGMTIPKWFHLHLLVLKREEI